MGSRSRLWALWATSSTRFAPTRPSHVVQEATDVVGGGRHRWHRADTSPPPSIISPKVGPLVTAILSVRSELLCCRPAAPTDGISPKVGPLVTAILSVRRELLCCRPASPTDGIVLASSGSTGHYPRGQGHIHDADLTCGGHRSRKFRGVGWSTPYRRIHRRGSLRSAEPGWPPAVQRRRHLTTPSARVDVRAGNSADLRPLCGEKQPWNPR